MSEGRRKRICLSINIRIYQQFIKLCKKQNISVSRKLENFMIKEMEKGDEDSDSK